MNTNFKSLIDFLEHFKDEATCVKHFASIRFRKGKYCPHCGHTEVYTFANGKRYRCAACRQDFTIKTGTVFGESKLPLRKWFIAIYLLTTCRKGISSVQLAKQVGVTQKTAWFVDHRIREAVKQGKGLLSGVVEVDETYVGGKQRNRHFNKRMKGTRGRSTLTKTPVMGFYQRGGKVRAEVTDSISTMAIESLVVNNVRLGTTLYTDEFVSYSKLGKLFPHKVVRHKAGQFATKGGINSNGIESFWAIFKRGYYGIYHQMSKKHLHRYVNEFAYRFNMRAEEIADVFDDVTERVAGSERLTYKALTRKA